jgi:hypothetical protein
MEKRHRRRKHPGRIQKSEITREQLVDALAQVTGLSKGEVAATIRAIKSCVLCGKRPDMIGIVIPDNPEDFGANPGEPRTILYGICADCQATPGSAQCVEDKIIADMANERKKTV